jgi:hypothetical protein
MQRDKAVDQDIARAEMTGTIQVNNKPGSDYSDEQVIEAPGTSTCSFRKADTKESRDSMVFV